jgi:hypothetical protein
MMQDSKAATAAPSHLSTQLRRVGAVGASLGLAALGLIGLAGTASAAECGTVKDTTVTNRWLKVGEAHYTINCSNGYVLVTGRVADSKPDGHCVEAKVIAGGYQKPFRACGDGNNTTIDFKVVGNSAEVYTYRV